jgi:hypothetical protein
LVIAEPEKGACFCGLEAGIFSRQADYPPASGNHLAAPTPSLLGREVSPEAVPTRNLENVPAGFDFPAP